MLLDQSLQPPLPPTLAVWILMSGPMQSPKPALNMMTPRDIPPSDHGEMQCAEIAGDQVSKSAFTFL